MTLGTSDQEKIIFKHQDALDALTWLIEMGNDECIDTVPVNRFNLAPVAVPKPDQTSMVQRAVSTDSIAPQAARPASGPKAVPARAPAASEGAGAKVAAEAAASAKTLQDLEMAIKSFDGGHIQRAATSLVFARGNADASLMIIGDFPGSEEDRDGKPFIGPAGQLLDKILSAAGFVPERDAYLTNLLPWRPIGSKRPSTPLIASFLPFLRRHIALIQPKIVLCLGDIPARALLETDQSISRLRGRWQDITFDNNTVKSLTTYHPTYLLNHAPRKADVWRDILELKAQLAKVG